MTKIVSALLLFSMLLSACSKKINPNKSADGISKREKALEKPAENTDAATSVTTPSKPTYIPAKKITPKSIAVNDAVAKKAVDGRLYYDLQGKRYWKNYKDGKYYLYDKSMNGNPDYMPRQ